MIANICPLLNSSRLPITDYRLLITFSHPTFFPEKNPIGKSFAVRNPDGASNITGIEFTATDAVAMSPCAPPGITKLIFGCPFNSTVSAGSFAPTYICSSM